MLVRADGLAASMSRYLIRRIEENPRITLHTRTEIEALEGDGHLERVRWRVVGHRRGRDPSDPSRLPDDRRRAQHGLDRRLPRPRRQGLRQGGHRPQRRRAGRAPAGRSSARRYLLETSLPGVFVVGDVRAGSVKRVASAVGEGSICVQLVHKALAE